LHAAWRIADYNSEQGLARVVPPEDIAALIRARAYRPTYPD
jgi:hypothetical protein